MLVAAEFMPVSLLTPIAGDLGSSQGMIGQAISVSGLFAVMASLYISPLAGRMDRRYFLLGLTALLMVSLVLISQADSYLALIIARSVLGVAVGGFWALSTATIMRLAPEGTTAKALGILYAGDALASAFAAPVGSYIGGNYGWRNVFLGMVPLVLLNLVWQWWHLPTMPAQRANSMGTLLRLLRRRDVAIAMFGLTLTFSGVFCIFSYMRPFLEIQAEGEFSIISGLLLAMGLAGFVGTYLATVLVERFLGELLVGLPLAVAAISLCLVEAGSQRWVLAGVMGLMGVFNSAVFVVWSSWLARAVADNPESGAGLMVASIQISVMAGAGLGGFLLDGWSINTTFVGGAVLLLAAALVLSHRAVRRPLAIQCPG
ncbi:MFS transporter [Pseudomonas syringae]|uniref:MFS transporter n=1 Tax=Pseudomonas syringae TaxID=317 RepID=UPI00215A651B|nr:MFS transporter [Pseudomonas syringae]MCR8721575.1 MFS transporter [Pseudomonas syringae]